MHVLPADPAVKGDSWGLLLASSRESKGLLRWKHQFSFLFFSQSLILDSAWSARKPLAVSPIPEDSQTLWGIEISFLS